MKRLNKNWDDKKVESKIEKLLQNFDDGELFIEEVFSENILFDDNKIKNASYDQDKGFGLRAVENDSVTFTHNTELNENSIDSALRFLKNSKNNVISPLDRNNLKTNKSLYTNDNPINMISLSEKINFLKKVNNYARKLDSKVKEVSVSLNGNYQNIEIVTKNGNSFYDSRIW